MRPPDAIHRCKWRLDNQRRASRGSPSHHTKSQPSAGLTTKCALNVLGCGIPQQLGLADNRIPRTQYQAAIDGWFKSSGRACSANNALRLDASGAISEGWEFRYSCMWRSMFFLIVYLLLCGLSALWGAGVQNQNRWLVGVAVAALLALSGTLLAYEISTGFAVPIVKGHFVDWARRKDQPDIYWISVAFMAIVFGGTLISICLQGLPPGNDES